MPVSSIQRRGDFRTSLMLDVYPCHIMEHTVRYQLPYSAWMHAMLSYSKYGKSFASTDTVSITVYRFEDKLSTTEDGCVVDVLRPPSNVQRRRLNGSSDFQRQWKGAKDEPPSRHAQAEIWTRVVGICGHPFGYQLDSAGACQSLKNHTFYGQSNGESHSIKISSPFVSNVLFWTRRVKIINFSWSINQWMCVCVIEWINLMSD